MTDGGRVGSQGAARAGGARGSAGVLVVCVTGATLAATLAVLAWSTAVQGRQRAEAAADMAALAAARASMRGGEGCVAAGAVVDAMAVRLTRCRVDADGRADVEVAVDFDATWLRRLDVPPARARARAGVPP